MSKLLIDEEPLQVLPSLAKAIGLNEALFLQQLHYWLQKSKHEHDERRWTYNTYEEWHDQFPFWSLRTMQRIVKSLLDLNLIVVHQFTATDRDQKNWYSIEYPELRALSGRIVSDHDKLASSKATRRRRGRRQFGAMDDDNLALSDHDKMAPSLRTENSSEKEPTENTTESTPASRVFACWRETLNHPKARIDEKRKKLINARLRDGYTVDDLCIAIRGCAESPFHMGQNDRNTVYDDITLICRDAKHVDQFMQTAQGDNGNGFKPSEARAEARRVRDQKIAAKMGYEYHG